MRCRRTQINQLLATVFLAGIILPARADNPIAKELQRLRRTVLRPILWRIRAIQRSEFIVGGYHYDHYYGWHHFYGHGFGARHFGGGFHR
jgi:hypothetical protein